MSRIRQERHWLTAFTSDDNTCHDFITPALFARHDAAALPAMASAMLSKCNAARYIEYWPLPCHVEVEDGIFGTSKYGKAGFYNTRNNGRRRIRFVRHSYLALKYHHATLWCHVSHMLPYRKA